MNNIPAQINEPPYHTPGRERCMYCSRMMDLNEMREFMGERFCEFCQPGVVKKCSSCGLKWFTDALTNGVCELCQEGGGK